MDGSILRLLALGCPLALLGCETSPFADPNSNGSPISDPGFAGTGVGMLYALTVVSGQYNDLVGELFRISST